MKVFCFIFFLCLSKTAIAQHTTVHKTMLWFNYNNYIILNDKYTLVNDVQVRTSNWADNWSQFAVRSGVHYKLNKHFLLGGGFAWFGTMRSSAGQLVLANEWRPWQEIAHQQKWKATSFMQRLRTEQRFLQQVADGKRTGVYNHIHRLRYRFEFGWPFAKNKFDFHTGNEVMVNPQYIGSNMFFDQNRSFAFINYNLSKKIFLQWQYIKIFQWRAATKVLENQDVFRFSIHHRINHS